MSRVIADSLATMEAALDECADDPLYGLSDTELVALLQRVDTLANKMHGTLTLPLLAEVDGRDLGRREGASSTQAWLRHALCWLGGKATNLVRLATAVRDQLPATAKALQAGEISADTATAIHKTIGKLPSGTTAEMRGLAEQIMLDNAGMYDPSGLEKFGDTVYERIAPDDAERKLGEQLAKQERRARQQRSLTFHQTGTPGLERADLRLETEAMAKLRDLLDPLSMPRPSTPEGLDLRPHPQRQADAFTEIVDALHRVTPEPADPEPAPEGSAAPSSDGGRRRLRRPQLLVTVGLNSVTQKLGIGTLDTGQRLSPQTMARLACQAQLTPIYLDPNGSPLHVGSKSRFFGDRDRMAPIVRDGGCAFPGCDRKPKWCDAHHVIPFRISHHTRVDEGVLLCSYHHHVIHQREWKVQIAADGLPEFIPPVWLDAQQKPLRNTMHHR